jgi:copper transport protein
MALCALVGQAGTAAAHAALTGSTPEDGEVLDAPVESAELQFNEPIDAVEDAVVLYAADGSEIAVEVRSRDNTVEISLSEPLGEGTHTLTYRVVSADGHPVAGALTFHVGHPSDAVAPVAAQDGADASVGVEASVVLLTALQYLGLLTFAGLVFFLVIIERSGRSATPGARRVLAVSLAVAVVASSLLVPVLAVRVTAGDLTTLADPGAWTGQASSDAVATAAIVLLAGTGAYAAARASSSVVTRGASVACALLAVATPVLVGHSRTVEPTWLVALADVGHLLAGAFWLGGVTGLLLHLRAVRSAGTGPADAVDRALEVTSRFSRLALYSVVLLALSGGTMALLVLDSVDQLVGTRYGIALLAKLAVVAAVVAVAALNRLRILPRIAGRPTAEHRWHGLRRTLTGEAVLLVVVVAITGLLTSSSPTTVDDGTTTDGGENVQNIAIDIESQGLAVTGEIAPAASGPNVLTFTLTYEGTPVESGEVEVSARLPALDIGPITSEATQVGPADTYEADLTLPTGGEWEIQVSARVSTYDAPIALTTITVQ